MRGGNVPKAIGSRYILRDTLGSGGFGKVKLAEHILTGELVAIKIVNKVKLGDDLPRVFREVEALKQLHHEHIAQLFEVVETTTHVYIVMEYCAGGELFEHIVARERLNEDEARTFFREIVASVAFVHHTGFAHRDIKPENFLLNRQRSIKLIDFGLCAKLNGEDSTDKPISNPQMLQTCCGSPAYAAPELLSGHAYAGDMADAWSLGVLLYALLVGTLPFDDENLAVLYQKILAGRFHVPSFLSEESVALLRQLLQVDPRRRITVRHLLTHPWLCKPNTNNFFTFSKTQGNNRPLELLAGNLTPVRWESGYVDKLKMPDREVMFELVVKLGIPYDNLLATLSRDPKTWAYDQVTAVYLLLWRRKLAANGNRMNWRLREFSTRSIPTNVPSSTGALENGNSQDFQESVFSNSNPGSNTIGHAASNDAISPRSEGIRKPIVPNSASSYDHTVDFSGDDNFDPNNGWLSENSIASKENVNPSSSLQPHQQFSPTFAFSAPTAKNRAACKSSGANQAAHVFLPATTGHMKPLTPVNDRRTQNANKGASMSPLMPSRSIDSIIVNPSTSQIVPPQINEKGSPGRSGSVDSMIVTSPHYGKPGSTPPTVGSSSLNSATPTATYNTAKTKQHSNLRTVVPNPIPSPSATPGRRFIASIRNFFTPHAKIKRGGGDGDFGTMAPPGAMHRRNSSASQSHPRVIRGAVGHDITCVELVGTDSIMTHSENVMSALRRALDEIVQIRYDNINDWKLQCTINNDWGKAQLMFALEVVILHSNTPSSSSSANQETQNHGQTIGIRRKRVRGDVWTYGRTVGTVLQRAQDLLASN